MKKRIKVRKRPVVVEAYECTREEIIHTLEGDMTASVGDFVIIGIKGERYPCKPDVFWRTYEQVPGDTPATAYF